MRRCVILICILAVLAAPVLALDVLEEERQILNVDTLTASRTTHRMRCVPTVRPRAQIPAKRSSQSSNGHPDCLPARCGRLYRRRLCC